MAIISLIILAIGLSMDSLAVALTSGAVLKNHLRSSILKIAGILAFTQLSLTIAGWTVGHSIAIYIQEIDHWLAFGILLFLGIRVIIESLRKQEKESSSFNPLNIKVMLGLALATSIDATAVGLSLSLLNQPILLPAFVIGLVTFIMASGGIIFGSKIGQKFNNRINLAGGIILIVIGCSILANHTIWADSQSSILQTINFANL